MKFVNYLRFVDDLSRVSATQKKHLAYIEELAKADRVWAAGPLTDRAGVLLVYEAPDLNAAEEIVRNDPFIIDGAIASYDLHPWDARVLRSTLGS